MQNNSKFCVNCKHALFTYTRSAAYVRETSQLFCHHPDLVKIDVVYGNKIPLLARFVRSSDELCGKSGKLFEEVPKKSSTSNKILEKIKQCLKNMNLLKTC